MSTLSSQTFHPVSVSQLGAQFFRALGSIVKGIQTGLTAVVAVRKVDDVQSVQDLLALADQYETSHPSQAADLRAAAMRYKKQFD